MKMHQVCMLQAPGGAAFWLTLVSLPSVMATKAEEPFGVLLGWPRRYHSRRLSSHDPAARPTLWAHLESFDTTKSIIANKSNHNMYVLVVSMFAKDGHCQVYMLLTLLALDFVTGLSRALLVCHQACTH